MTIKKKMKLTKTPEGEGVQQDANSAGDLFGLESLQEDLAAKLSVRQKSGSEGSASEGAGRGKSRVFAQFSISEELTLPLIPLRGLLALPNISMEFEISRSGSEQALRRALEDKSLILLAPQLSDDEEWPKKESINPVACLCNILDVMESPQRSSLRVRVEGIVRCTIVEYQLIRPYFMAKAKPVLEGLYENENELKAEACRRAIVKRFQSLMELVGRPNQDLLRSLLQLSDPADVVDIVATNVDLSFAEQMELLNETDALSRLYSMLIMMEKERQLAGYVIDLEEKVKQSIDEGQREYYLREQLKVIHEELGEQENADEEIQSYLSKLQATNMKADDKQRLEKEIRKLSKYPPGFPEAAVSRNYLDLVFELPWGAKVKEKLNIKRAREQLNRDHYGLEKVKERLLEYLAVRLRQVEKAKENDHSPILCLVGPPGVGKTSVAMSIAKALGRPYVRMSLGGVRDEADIRGHRRTYIGALPGRVIHALKQAKADNALILLDELDKLGHDYRGDPSSALLEVLDPEQNKAFHDHYLDIDYDLSQVLFLTTANNAENIPPALLDRMEVIELNGYTEEEKYHIARLHLWPKQMKVNAIERNEARMLKDGFMTLIRDYTREAGVRQMEQMLSKVCRRLALRLSEAEAGQAELNLPLRLGRKELVAYLGRERFHYDTTDQKDHIGQATGLAWTAVGGDTLTIEVAVVPGSGNLELTGHLGQVMQESAKVALAFVRSKASLIGLESDFFKHKDIHVHVPEGAIPKDGPSAGITLATALYSALTGIAVRHDVAMTGEITMRGRVLPIGGLKEKLIAAQRAGIKTVLIPEDNLKDIDDLPQSVRRKLTILPMHSAEEVLAAALAEPVPMAEPVSMAEPIPVAEPIAVRDATTK